jgi:hypothetical protein
LQKRLETGKPYAHRMYHLINNELNAEFTQEKLPTKCDILLKTNSLSDQKLLKESMKKFYEKTSIKWSHTRSVNLSNNVFGKSGLFKKCLLFDPFMKKSMPTNYEFYENIFQLI